MHFRMTHEAKIVDVWMQQPNPGFLEQPFLDSLRRWTRRPELPCPTLEDTLRVMDKAGVGLGLLSAWWGPAGPMITNDEVAECVRRHPDRFAGIASVDLSRPMNGIRELRRCVRELGFRGLRIVPWLWNLPPDDRRYYPLYAECIELGIPFCLQVGHTGPLLPSEPGRPIPYLEHVALEFPELQIVAGHIGHPWTQEMISLLTKCENVFVDTSAYVPRRFPPDFRDFLRTRGGGKVMFGSNYPMLAPGACLEGIDEMGLEPETREAYLHETARRVFGLDRS
jgi:predicted TIM-barrel fold metal-dependent hydrolase